MSTMLNDKTVIVTGGASGIGRGIAIAAANHGAKAVIIGDLTDQSKDEGGTTLSILEQMGVKCHFAKTDVTQEADLIALVDCANQHGGVDLMVANAGIALPGDNETITGENFQKLIDVNLRGVMFTAQAAAQQMKTNKKEGSIVAISSMGGLRGSRLTLGYSATKGGVNLLVKGLADALGPDGIRVNAVCPGMINTSLSKSSPEVAAAMDTMRHRMPLRRIADVKEVGDVVCWLGSEFSSFVTGAAIPVDGGQTAVI